MKRHWGHQQTAGVTAWAVLAALTLAPSVASAQDGAIAGTVTDTTSLVLPGVTVEVRSTVAGGLAQTVFTDGTGTFTLTALPPGTYDVTFTLPGFGTVVRGGVAISAGATATLDVEMSVQLAEQVVVVGSRAQPRSATASAVPVDVISTQESPARGPPISPTRCGPSCPRLTSTRSRSATQPQSSGRPTCATWPPWNSTPRWS